MNELPTAVIIFILLPLIFLQACTKSELSCEVSGKDVYITFMKEDQDDTYRCKKLVFSDGVSVDGTIHCAAGQHK